MANFCLSPRFLSELAVLGSFFTLPYRSFASCLSTFLIYDMDGSILSWSLTSRNTFWAETICPFFSIILLVRQCAVIGSQPTEDCVAVVVAGERCDWDLSLYDGGILQRWDHETIQSEVSLGRLSHG